MAVIGYLGKSAGEGVVFTVSEELLETIDNVVWSGSARYAVHQRHMGDALTEFVGLDPDAFAFDITLLAELGVDPLAELVKLWTFEREGTALQLVLGTHGYGKYRWCITSHKAKAKYFDVHGDLYCVTVTVQLQEYLRS